MASDPKILGLALLGGIIPALLWLWFWIKEEEKKPEPKGLITMVFILGMTGVIFVLPIQKFIQSIISSPTLESILLSSTEEIMKYLIVLAILYGTTYIDEPIEWPIYLITAALGFAALENGLYLIKPLAIENTTTGLLTAASLGQLRFLGATLLHAVSSGILGIALGISLHMGELKKKLHLMVGLILAITLHSTFNFSIMRIRGGEADYFLEILKVFGFLWVVTIIVMLLFEKVRRMN